ncbi:extracellular catalytic domain type 1 short-chain-length polyhydroxyalkanoate depolymerase [Sorangium atrum]|uniref:MYXO-CTERM-sorted multifunctional esterase n=1 Tax=Sorangium atrum TaxID=2995308 RepID=A0ABT5BV19_9BACT|nr:MYXO-CTERM-sorted multifunctional esterase [Sorangium aterium]MDC0677410.1 MYXO-CTERM-sorted multifunctional esterase [Sorangium aterium]
MNQSQNHALGFASLSLALLFALPARGASLQKVNQSEWGTDGLPSYVNMYIYVPDKLATKPPIVVAPHHCQGNGQGTFSEMSSLVSIANTSGFIMIFPEATGQNCWDAGSTRSLHHGGGGDTGAIVQMVKYTLAKYNGDGGRVYSVGGSSGGIMTEALLGVYPDVFMAGVSLMGVPCGCWAEGYNDVTGTGNSAQWSGPCGGGNVTKTGQQWGDLVRSYYPGYTGHRPRLQHWHGTADTVLNYKNMAEDVKEWTNLLGLSETADGTDTPKRGTTRQFWKSSCGYTVYETFAMDGVGHAVPFDGPAVAAYFGLDKAGGQDPETAACPGAVPGGDGTDGAGGAGGAAGTGGAGSAAGTGGAANAAGTGGAGGTAGTGGEGGAMESGSGGSVGSGGAIDSGSAGANGQDASSGAGDATGGDSSSSGCSCALGNDARDSGAQAGFLLAALGLLLGRPKRRPR